MAGLAIAFGSGAMTNSIEEIQGADCIFIIGSNTTVAHPLISPRIFKALENGAKLIVADPRRIQLAAMADVYAQHRLGTDVALINGMMHVIHKNGWHDEAFVKERTEDFDKLLRVIEQYTPEKVSEITGVAAETIEKMAELYGKAERASTLYAMGITQHITGVDNVKSLANLCMLTGNIGRESTGLNPLRGQNNVQGACDMGGLPNVYPGYQVVSVEDLAGKFGGAWGSKMPTKPGMTLTDAFPAIEEGKIKAMVIMGENPLVSDADAHHVEKAVEKLEFLLCIDIFPTSTTRLADVVLPAASFAEKDGTFTNTERRVQLVRKAIEPIGESRPDWMILQELSTRFGYKMEYASPKEIMDEIAGLTPSYGGVYYERLEGDGLCWPCPTPEHPGTKFLHEGKFSRGKGLFHAIEYRPPAEQPDENFPLWFTTGRVFTHYHTGTMTRNSPSLHHEMAEGYVELHPGDAHELGLKDGELATVSSRRGAIDTRVFVTDRVEKGTAFMPFHFVEAAANVLTNTARDEIAKIPEFKVCAVKIEKAA